MAKNYKEGILTKEFLLRCEFIEMKTETTSSVSVFRLPLQGAMGIEVVLGNEFPETSIVDIGGKMLVPNCTTTYQLIRLHELFKEIQ